MTTPTPGRFDAERLAVVDALTLDPGTHPGPSAGACVMEAVAYLAGEPYTDAPDCASPVIAAFLRAWNDVLDHRRRQELKRYVGRLAGSRGTPAQESQRADLVADWIEQVEPALPAGRRGLVPVRAAALTALYALDDPTADPWLPAGRGWGGRIPWITRPTVDLVHHVIEQLLAVTEHDIAGQLDDERPAAGATPPTSTARPGTAPAARPRRPRTAADRRPLQRPTGPQTPDHAPEGTHQP